MEKAVAAEDDAAGILCYTLPTSSSNCADVWCVFMAAKMRPWPNNIAEKNGGRPDKE